MQNLSPQLDAVTALFLGRIQFLGDNMKELVPESTAQRRHIIGLKEVVRKLKQSQLRAMIIAPDLQEDPTPGGLDDRMREAIEYGYKHGVKVVFALSRKRLGRALGKSLNISILGITDTTGANVLFHKMTALADENRNAWLSNK